MKTCNWSECLKNTGLLALRVLVGYGIALHGWQKMTGDVEGFAQTVVAGMGIPFPLFFAWAAALSEGVGGILIALGLVTRVGAFSVLMTMGTAFFVFHAADAWGDKELAYMYGSAALSLLLTGGGRYSLDALIFCRRCCSKMETP